MKLRIALVGEFPGLEELYRKIDLILEEMIAYLTDEVKDCGIEFLLAPEYTGELWFDWLKKQKGAVTILSMEKSTAFRDRDGRRITIDTAFRNLIGESLCDRTDAMIALWNEKPYERKGATWEVLSLAYKKSLPCVWLSSVSQNVYCIHKSYYELYSPAKLREMTEGFTEDCFLEELRDLKPGRFIQFCMKLRARYLARYKADQSRFEGKTDRILQDDFQPEAEDGFYEPVRQRLLQKFRVFDSNAIILNDCFQSVIYVRSILPFIATVFMAVAVNVNGILGKTFVGGALGQTETEYSSVATWIAAAAFFLHALINLFVYRLSKSERIGGYRADFVESRTLAELLRIMLHFKPYGIGLDLKKLCSGNDKMKQYLGHLCDEEETSDVHIDGCAIRLALTRVDELLDEQIAYHKRSVVRYKGIVTSLTKWWENLAKISFAVVIFRSFFQAVLNSPGFAAVQGLYGGIANLLAMILPAWAAYFSSKSAQNNFVYNYNNHSRMAEKLTELKERIDPLLLRDAIPMELVEVIIGELSDIMVAEDSAEWQRQYMSTEIKPL